MNNLHLQAVTYRGQDGPLYLCQIRQSQSLEEAQVTFFVTKEINLLPLAEALKNKIPAIKGIFKVVNPDLSSTTPFNESLTRLIGETDFIHEMIEGKRLYLAPDSFYQTNPGVAIEIFTQIRDYIKNNGPADKIIDGYAGIGTLSVMLSDLAQKIYAIEVNPASFKGAKKNFLVNGIKNVTFLSKKFSQGLKELQPLTFDYIILDPPREGLTPKVANLLTQMNVKHLIYLSCNPSSLGRDLAILGNKYSIKQIKPFDMFPQTALVEALVFLEPVKKDH
jgi:23S rRNA (uracil1939-C5)-methyltransferase